MQYLLLKLIRRYLCTSLEKCDWLNQLKKVSGKLVWSLSNRTINWRQQLHTQFSKALKTAVSLSSSVAESMSTYVSWNKNHQPSKGNNDPIYWSTWTFWDIDFPSYRCQSKKSLWREKLHTECIHVWAYDSISKRKKRYKILRGASSVQVDFKLVFVAYWMTGEETVRLFIVGILTSLIWHREV